MSSNRFELVALGTGTCANGYAHRRKAKPPAFLILWGEHQYLFDCGEGTRFWLEEEGFDYRRVTRIMISHGHPDHAVLPPFIQAKLCGMMAADREGARVEGADRLTIYLPRMLEVSFADVWRWHVPETPDYWPQFKPDMRALDSLSVHALDEGAVLKAFNVYHGHGKHPAMGFRLETEQGRIAYTGDAGYTPELTALADRADILIADCSTAIGEEYVGGYGHMGPFQCGTLAKEARVHELWMTHYFGWDTPAAMAEEAKRSGFTGRVIVATDGMRWKRKTDLNSES